MAIIFFDDFKFVVIKNFFGIFVFKINDFCLFLEKKYKFYLI